MNKKGLIIILVVLFSIGLCLFSCGVLGPLGRDVVVRPHIQMPAEHVRLGFLSLPNSLIATLITDVILIVGAVVGTRFIRARRPEAWRPKGLQNLIEGLIEALSGLLRNVMGERGLTLLPLLATFFLFILVANWIELFPGFDSIGLVEHAPAGVEGHALREIGPLALITSAEGEYTVVPFLRASNTDLNTPLALALVSVVMTQVYGVRALGWGYFSRFINLRALARGKAMGIMDLFVGLLEGMSEITKIISFAFRLFGNVFAGMVLLLVISSLVPFLGPVIFYALELFVGAVQALVFMMLTAAFIAMATMGHGEEH